MSAHLPPPDWPNRAFSQSRTIAPHRWHVQRAGSGSPALLLHGAGASAHSWAPLTDALAGEMELLMPDLPGHGFTKSPRGRASLPDFANDVAALVHSEAMDPEIIIGHSAGGAVALEMIRRGLLKPRKLVILNGALEDFRGMAGVLFPVLAKVLALNPLTGFFLPSGPQAVKQARSLIATTGSRLPDRLLMPYARLISQKSHVDGTLAMMSQWSLADLNRALPEIVTPTLFLHGAKDEAVDLRAAERAASAMPQAKLVVLEDIGHLSHEEAPDRVAMEIKTFAALAEPTN